MNHLMSLFKVFKLSKFIVLKRHLAAFVRKLLFRLNSAKDVWKILYRSSHMRSARATAYDVIILEDNIMNLTIKNIEWFHVKVDFIRHRKIHI